MPISKSELETYKLAKNIAKKIKNGGIVCLFGELGTGKTTFTKGIAQYLEINEFLVKSPTYTYIRKHSLENKRKLFHVDLFRLGEIDDLLLQELNEIMENKNNIVIIEWAEKMGEYLPSKGINVYFKYINENKREITYNL